MPAGALMKHRWLCGSIVALRLALAWEPAPADTSETAPGAPVAATDVEAMLRDGRYREAYEASLRRPGADDDRACAAARALLGVSMESPDSWVRWFALRAAQPLDDPSLASHARSAAAGGDRYEQSLALDILVRADLAANRDLLLSALASPYRSVRLRGLNGLATLRDPELVESFSEVLLKDPDPDLRVFAARALAQTGSPQATPGLYRALEDEVPAVRGEAVLALVSLGDPGLTAVLRHRLGEAVDEERASAVRLVGLAADASLIADLGPFLGDPDPEVRAQAAAAILAIHERSARRP
jgi:hypothetical protein